MPSDAFLRSRKRRQGTELVCERVFRPLAHLVVLALAPLRVPPPLVAAASGATGIVAAVELGRGELLAAALVLQLKTVLDNADGQLARLTGRTSAFGRYLDSELDLLVDAALFAALGWHTDSVFLPLAGFVAMTAVLSVNFNAERLARGAAAEPEPEAAGGRATALLRRVYGLVYAPQDRVAERLVARRPALAEPLSVSLLANLGMSTQLLALGVLVAAGHPLVFPALVLVEVALVAVLALPVRRPNQQEVA
ncbi:MAG TPA: CDP-alcohol phosphatidyltransferase family protein [Gaiellaceae bacterium]|nr:CDP-alcohol phosphatidyltransferase family protein [Gaiellaceae bacterium]